MSDGPPVYYFKNNILNKAENCRFEMFIIRADAILYAERQQLGSCRNGKQLP
jgi:hypothetical protein